MTQLLQLGDMTLLGNCPPKMTRALAVIATTLHPAYDKCSGFESGVSKGLCLFASLAVRDFLVKIGYTDATVHGVAFYIAAHKPDGEELHSLGIGVPGVPDLAHKFNGHAVCIVPSLKLLIDTTLYQAIRPEWGGALSGMMTTDYSAPRRNQCNAIAALTMARDDRRVEMFWLDRPELDWRKSEDFRVRNARRVAVTRALVTCWGSYNEP